MMLCMSLLEGFLKKKVEAHSNHLKMYVAITTHQAELTDLKFFIEKSTGFTQE